MKSRLWAVMAFGFFLGVSGLPLPAADTTPPQLVSLSLSATTVDASLYNTAVTVIVRVTDDLAGVAGPRIASLGVTFASPSKSQHAGASFYPFIPQSGTATDGIYTAFLSFRRYSEPGTWTVDSATLRDAVGNERTLTLSDFLAAGFPTQVTVQGTGDVTPPQLASLSFSSATVDITETDQFVTVTARLTDDLSGITIPGSGSISFVSPSHTQRISVYLYESNRESGSATDGVYTNNLFIPRYSEPGIWTVDQASLRDGTGNQRTLFLSDFLAVGWPSQITVHGTGDTTPPQITDLSVSTTTVDTTIADQKVYVRMHITDDLAGVSAPPPPLRVVRANVTYVSPSRAQHASAAALWIPQSDSPTDGIYTNYLILPRYSEPGIWIFAEAEVYDLVGNVKNYGLVDFLAAGWPTQILVTEQPTLRLLRSGESALVSWPVSAEGFALQSKSSLDSGVLWTNVPGAPALFGENRVLSLPVGEGAAFFRLLKPSP